MITAVTIAVGDRYRTMAERAAGSVHRCTGLEPIIVDQVPAGGCVLCYKLTMLERFGGTILWFDADTYFVRPWDVSRFDGCREIVAVRNPMGRTVGRDVRRFHLPAESYINTGLFFATAAHHAGVFAEALRIAGENSFHRKTKLCDQTALNVAVQRSHAPLCLLPVEFNAVMAYPLPPRPVVLHGAGANRFKRSLDAAVAEQTE